MATSRSSNIAPRTRTFPPPLPKQGHSGTVRGSKLEAKGGLVFGHDLTRMLPGGTSMLRA